MERVQGYTRHAFWKMQCHAVTFWNWKYIRLHSLLANVNPFLPTVSSAPNQLLLWPSVISSIVTPPGGGGGEEGRYFLG